MRSLYIITSLHFVADVLVAGVGWQAGILLGPGVRELQELVLVIKCLESNLVRNVPNGHGQRHPFVPEEILLNDERRM